MPFPHFISVGYNLRFWNFETPARSPLNHPRRNWFAHNSSRLVLLTPLLSCPSPPSPPYIPRTELLYPQPSRGGRGRRSISPNTLNLSPSFSPFSPPPSSPSPLPIHSHPPIHPPTPHCCDLHPPTPKLLLPQPQSACPRFYSMIILLPAKSLLFSSILSLLCCCCSC